jgi:hypothetical protein
MMIASIDMTGQNVSLRTWSPTAEVLRDGGQIRASGRIGRISLALLGNELVVIGGRTSDSDQHSLDLWLVDSGRTAWAAILPGRPTSLAVVYGGVLVAFGNDLVRFDIPGLRPKDNGTPGQ